MLIFSVCLSQIIFTLVTLISLLFMLLGALWIYPIVDRGFKFQICRIQHQIHIKSSRVEIVAKTFLKIYVFEQYKSLYMN